MQPTHTPEHSLLLGQPMPGARDHSKELGYRVQEVEDLGYEEEQQCLAEVAQNPNDCKGHTGKIAESVADKYSRWVPCGGGEMDGVTWGRQKRGGRGGGRRGGVRKTARAARWGREGVREEVSSPVMFEQCRGHGYEGKDEVEGEGVLCALRAR